MLGRVEVPIFTTVLWIVVVIAAVSAMLAVALTIANAFVPMAQAPELVQAFIEAFKACLFTILGLLGGRAASRRMP